MKLLFISILAFVAWGLPALTEAQISTGSNGSDGVFSPTANVNINMADHPTGIYQYSSVNIPAGVTVTFTPNANNTPIYWLVQGTCVITGTINIQGKGPTGVPYPARPCYQTGGLGGPGGWSGGNGGASPSPGQGPGGGSVAGSGNFSQEGSATYNYGGNSGAIYGNQFLLPLFGGSGGGGMSTNYSSGAGGGGGAILIAAPNAIQLNGMIDANANLGFYSPGGSGGAVRLVCSTLQGNGSVIAGPSDDSGGLGRIRVDAQTNNFAGTFLGSYTQGFQPIIIPIAGQGTQIAITSIGGAPVAANPTGQPSTPDVTISSQLSNPLSIVISCTNLPLNTPITLTVTPTNSTPTTVQSVNNVGTQSSSTATFTVSLPHGAGVIYAQTVTAVLTASNREIHREKAREPSYATTGLTTSGERFTKIEITASLTGKQRIVYLTDSGKRYPLPVQ